MNKPVPMEFNNQRILTTKVLAEAYKTKEDNIHANFKRNKERFAAGKHYYYLTGEELRAFKRSLTNSQDPRIKFASSLTLWTEKGAARHAKLLETDEAWKVFEELEDTYFRVREEKTDREDLGHALKMLQLLLSAAAQDQLDIKNLQEEVAKTKAQSEEAVGLIQLLEQRVNSLHAINVKGTPRQKLNFIINRYSCDNGIPISYAWLNFRKALIKPSKPILRRESLNMKGDTAAGS